MLIFHRGWQTASFAGTGSRLLSARCSAIFQGHLCFGTSAGAVLIYDGAKWSRITLGTKPVTALATAGDLLYAWSGGELLEIQFLIELEFLKGRDKREDVEAEFKKQKKDFDFTSFGVRMP